MSNSEEKILICNYCKSSIKDRDTLKTELNKKIDNLVEENLEQSKKIKNLEIKIENELTFKRRSLNKIIELENFSNILSKVFSHLQKSYENLLTKIMYFKKEKRRKK